jgi:hypothetical protein
MEDWITGVFAVLGTLMVLSGGTLIVLRTVGRLDPPADPATPGDSPATTMADQSDGRRFSLRRLSPASQLIGWGVVLLVVAAFTVGVISFGISLEAGTR